MKIFMKTVAMASVLAISASFVSAANIGFDDGSVVQTGTISYGGAGGALIGTDIIFNEVIGSNGVSANDGSILSCVGCKLNFVTGANLTEGPLPLFYTWASGGSFVVNGTLKDGLIDIITSDVILSGTFTGSPFSLNNSRSALFVANGNVIGNPLLLDFYGYNGPSEFIFANTELAIGSCNSAGAPGGFNCALQNADLNIVQVPVPATLPLMALGLAGLGFMRKRKIEVL